ACQVEGSSTIIWLIPEGERVQEGDELVILDSSSIENTLSSQQITYNTSTAKVASSLATLRTAELSLEEYIEGTFEQSWTEIENSIFTAVEEQKQKADSVRYTEQLLKLNYSTDAQLNVDRVAMQTAKNTVHAANLKKMILLKYSSEKQITELMSKIETAKADVDSNTYTNQLDKERLDHYRVQYENCTIRAPQDGQVVYANQDSRRWSSESDMIKEGATVRQRQVLIRLPDPTQMQVKAMVNESNIAAVKAGMPAIISFDAISGRSYQGEVIKVNQYPEVSWMSSAKDYVTIVKILGSQDEIASLRAGLTAEVRIIADRQENVLMVPVQCVLENNGKTYCLTDNDGVWGCKEVLLGASNEKQVIIIKGLEEGEKVVSGAKIYKNNVVFPAADTPSVFADDPTYKEMKKLQEKEKEVQESVANEVANAFDNMSGMPGTAQAGMPTGRPQGGMQGAAQAGMPTGGPQGGMQGAAQAGMPAGGPQGGMPGMLAGMVTEETEEGEKPDLEAMQEAKDKVLLKRSQKIQKYYDRTAMELCRELDINDDKYITREEIIEAKRRELMGTSITENFSSISSQLISANATNKVKEEAEEDSPENPDTSHQAAEVPLETVIEVIVPSDITNDTASKETVDEQPKKEETAVTEVTTSTVDADIEEQAQHAELLDFFDEWDTDKDGKLKRTELVIGFCTCRNLYQKSEQLNKASGESNTKGGLQKFLNIDAEAYFTQNDTNADGMLSESEYPADDADDLKWVAKNLDTDKDGNISREEFTKGISALKRKAGGSTTRSGSGGGAPPPPR
ncbi:MAG: EF-hand domain-containing protein, partial [Thermoguttaceae bacterium]|nr:EF-hand domain-containing protein [Thermoguttaceae bacterium]